MGVRPRLTKGRFKADVKEFLTEQNPRGRFTSIVKWLNDSEGCADSVAEFVRDYPWARGAFLAVARKCEAERVLMARRLARLKAAPQIQE